MNEAHDSGKGIPRVLRCCGYLSRRRQRWIGYCIELDLRAEGRDWEELQERLLMAASFELARIDQQPAAPPPRRARLQIRLLYAWIAALHFLRPHHERCLADFSSGLLLDSR